MINAFKHAKLHNSLISFLKREYSLIIHTFQRIKVQCSNISDSIMQLDKILSVLNGTKCVIVWVYNGTYYTCKCYWMEQNECSTSAFRWLWVSTRWLVLIGSTFTPTPKREFSANSVGSSCVVANSNFVGSSCFVPNLNSVGRSCFVANLNSVGSSCEVANSNLVGSSCFVAKLKSNLLGAFNSAFARSVPNNVSLKSYVRYILSSC